MVDNTNFSQKNVNDYMRRRLGYAFRHLRGYKPIEYNNSAILALFDKNNDSVISRKEFNSISKAGFDNYVKGLNEYNKDNGYEECKLSYDDVSYYLDDDFVTTEELEGNVKFYDIKNVKFEENMKLKDSSQMNFKDIKSELKTYGVPQNELDAINYEDSKVLLENLRQKRVLYDEGSNEVDYKIGTYFQGKNMLCSFLATISTFTPEQLQQIYKKKTDENGKIYYEVNFPNDRNSGRSVIITEEELNSGEITFEITEEDLNNGIAFKENGNEMTVSELPEGDKDVTLLSMAFMKRFGYGVYRRGADQYEIKEMLRTPEEAHYKRDINLTPENIKYLPKNSAVALLQEVQLEKKNLPTKFIELPEGITGEFDENTLKLSNGTVIHQFHSLAFKGIDTETQEIILTGNEGTNTSELRVPLSLAPYLQSATEM